MAKVLVIRKNHINIYCHVSFFDKGSKYITDSILGLKFRISAASFFQINTKSAEVLYDLAIKMGKVESSTTVLDICCGTGTIGLCFAKVIREFLQSL